MANVQKASAGKSKATARSKEEMAILASMSALPEGLKAELIESDPFERFPTVNAGQPGLTAGTVIFGIYEGTKRCYSETFNNPKRDAQDRAYRDLHLLRDLKNPNVRIGIWSVGSLLAMLSRLDRGTRLGVKYVGQADKPLKKGQEPPHVFKLIGLDGKPIVVDFNRQPQIDLADDASGDTLTDADAGVEATEEPATVQ